MGRTKTMHVAPHVSQVVVPRLHGLRAPWWPPSWHPPRAKTAKNGKSGSFFPKTGAAAGAYFLGVSLSYKIRIFSAACALRVSEATDNFKIGKT